MTRPFLGYRLLLAAIVLATAASLVASGAAVAQQQTPTELWEEYPLDPEQQGSQEPADEAPQDSGSAPGGVPARDGDGGVPAAAASDEGVSLLPILVGFLAVLLVLIPGVGMWAQGRGNGSLRERIGTVRFPSLPDTSRPVHAVSRWGRGFLEQRSWQAWSTTLLGTRGQAATLGPRETPRAGGKPPKPRKPPKPAAATAPKKKLAAHKPAKPQQEAKPQRPAKPERAPKPRRATKPPRAAKPRQAAKPRRAAKPGKPAPPAKRKRAAAKRLSSAPAKPLLTDALKPKPPSRKKAPPKPTPVHEEPAPVAVEESAEKTLKCAIFGWRDGTMADYYALASGLQGHDWIVERSPRFVWQGGDVPPEAFEAHALLVDALERSGWRHAGSEGVWYRQRFERPVEESVAEAESR